MIDQKYVKECFDYNPDTGDLIWKVRPREHFPTDGIFKLINARCAGKIAGSACAHGYWIVGLAGKPHKAHRIIWLFVHGELPLYTDHKNGVKGDNRISNLRSVTRTDNNRNAKQKSNNTSGFSGVSWRKSSKKWRADARINGKQQSLGLFTCKYAARDAVLKSQAEVGGYTERHGIAV